MAKRPDDTANPDLTPMIDCVFQLIIFFMVGCKFKSLESKLEAHLPKDMGEQSSMPAPDVTPRRIEIKVAGDYAIVDGKKVTQMVQVFLGEEDFGVYTRPNFGRDTNEKLGYLTARRTIYENLKTRLAELHMSDDPNVRTPTMIAPDLRVPADEVIQALDAVIGAGITDMTFSGHVADIDKMYREDGIER